MSIKQAFIFPGQGSQAVGMGHALATAYPAAQAVFQEVNDTLSQDLSGLMWEGPADALTLTENAQPALMAVSMAIMRVLEGGGIRLGAPDSPVAFVAGHSLGEYSALAAAGTVSIADTARLLRARGRAMQEAVAAGDGAMAALIGTTPENAASIATDAAQGDICSVANDNAPGQVVVSGTDAAVRRAAALAAERGVRAIMLPVSAPFHCALMAPAATVMAAELADTPMNPPNCPLVANVTAEPVREPDAIRALLVKQVTAPVRWRESICYMMAQGVGSFIEVGAGTVLTGLVKRIDRTTPARSLTDPEGIDGFMKDAEEMKNV